MRLLTLVMALLACPALVALTTEECAAVRQAHQELLAGSFTVDRTFRLTVNGVLKNRELARLTYSEGKLDTEVVDHEARSKMWVHDNEGKDFILEMEFDCERLEARLDWCQPNSEAAPACSHLAPLGAAHWFAILDRS